MYLYFVFVSRNNSCILIWWIFIYLFIFSLLTKIKTQELFIRLTEIKLIMFCDNHGFARKTKFNLVFLIQIDYVWFTFIFIIFILLFLTVIFSSEQCFCPSPQTWLRHTAVLQWCYSSGEFRWVYFSYLCKISPQEISTRRGKRDWEKSECCSLMELMTRAAWLMSSAPPALSR